jgi:hypothetical protein
VQSKRDFRFQIPADQSFVSEDSTHFGGSEHVGKHDRVEHDATLGGFLANMFEHIYMFEHIGVKAFLDVRQGRTEWLHVMPTSLGSSCRR